MKIDNQWDSKMPKGQFAQELLLRTSAQARAVCRDKLRQCANGRGDVIVASISPDLEAAKWLCALEEARWGGDIRDAKRGILVSACFLVLSLFALFASSAVVFTAASVFAAIGWIALLGIAAGVCAGSLKGFAGECMRLRALLRLGYSEGALNILTKHGRSLWLVGSDGLYLAIKRAAADLAPDIGFIKFDELRAPSAECYEDAAVVCLITTGNRLVSVMLFPGNAADQARAAADLIAAKIHLSRRVQSEGTVSPIPRQRSKVLLHTEHPVPRQASASHIRKKRHRSL